MAGEEQTHSEFVHVWRPPPAPGPNAAVLLLLHGTGGDENDLIPIAPLIDPSAGVLSVRGQVLENGMPRFFRRLSVGVFDEDDVRKRATDMATFLQAAAERRGFNITQLVAVGFSNGANIAAAVMWDHPEILRRAILFRAMLPYRDTLPKPLPSARVLLSAARNDQLIAPAEVERLKGRMSDAGAEVSVVWQPGGHALEQGDILAARSWLRGR